MPNAEQVIRDILRLADVEINGNRPWDITADNQQLYARLLRNGILGLGESYVDGWWDCDDLEDFIVHVLNADLEHRISPMKLLVPVLLSRIVNRQGKDRTAKDVQSHYDKGNVLFQNMLDSRMTYSSGYWRDAQSLDSAQESKLDLACRKLGLREGMHVLDIGCGWGSFLKFAAERYGITGVGVTLSHEQVALGKELCAGYPVEIRLQDYRDVNSSFDAVVSIGMFEHVGHKNYQTFMKKAEEVLERDGLFLLHTIGSNAPRYSTDPWTEKYIFPGSYLPTAEQITKAAKELFVMEDWHNFGNDYALTLKAWHANFTANWDSVLSSHYDERFYRMWTYMLLTYAGSFKARRNQLWQIVYSKKGVPGGYRSVR